MILERNKRHDEGWTPIWYGDDEFAIFRVTNDNGIYCINLKQNSCAYKK